MLVSKDKIEMLDGGYKYPGGFMVEIFPHLQANMPITRGLYDRHFMVGLWFYLHLLDVKNFIV